MMVPNERLCKIPKIQKSFVLIKFLFFQKQQPITNFNSGKYLCLLPSFIFSHLI